MSARINRVTTGQYHQVLAITQYMINSGLENLFIEQGFTDPTKRKPKNYQTLRQGFQNLVLGTPTIIIETLDDNHTNIFYRVHLKSGIFQSQVDPPEGQEFKETDVAAVKYVVNDWYFTFMVDLAQTVLKDDDDRKVEALKKLKRTMGKYTVQQLMVNMKTAKINSPLPNETSFGVYTKDDWNKNMNDDKINMDKMVPGQPRDWSKQPRTVQNTFNFIITQVIADLENANMQNLGITAQAVDASRVSVTDPGHPPTFMPVDCRFQMYPWKDPNDPNYREYNGFDGNGRLNYLLYLEMTGNADNTVPEVKQEGRFLQEVGNWTDGTKPGVDPRSQFGTFMLTSQKFIDEFLLSKFDKMNRMVKTDLENLKADCRTSGLYSYFDRNIDILIGAGAKSDFDPEDAKYRFSKDLNIGGLSLSNASNMFFPTQLPSNAVTWFWSFKDNDMKVHNSDRYLNIGYKAEHWGEATSQTITRLSIVPGQNLVLFEGLSYSRLYWEKDWDIVPNEKSELIVKANWSLKLRMTEVSDGGLAFKIEGPDLKTEFSGVNKGNLSGWETYIKGQYDKAAANFVAIANSLKNALEGQERFFLPASGIFFFKNPVFNHQGSLLCELEYNGNAKLDIVNPGAGARPAEGNTTIKDMGNQKYNNLQSDSKKNENDGKGSK